MKRVFKTIIILQLPIYITKYIVIYIWMDLFVLTKFITNIITVLPCTIILMYYGWHINKIIRIDVGFRKLVKIIVSFSIFRTVLYGISSTLKFTGNSI